jgi:hypothetical protein
METKEHATKEKLKDSLEPDRREATRQQDILKILYELCNHPRES